jgi:hypothetical protein
VKAMMLQWLLRCLDAERLAQANAEALIRDHGCEAYSQARLRERDVIPRNGTTHAGRTPKHWRLVALTVARKTGKRVGLDTATRMAMDADFNDRSGSASPEIKSEKVDPIDELKRLIGDGA